MTDPISVDSSKTFDESDAPKAAKKSAIVNAPAVQTKKGLTTTETGEVALFSLEDQLAFADRLIKEQMISTTFRTAQQVVIGFQYAKALKLNEIVALRMMYVVNGKPCLYGEGPLSLCQRAKEVASIDEFFLNQKMERICSANKNLNDPVFAAVTQVWRKGDPRMQEDTFSQEDLKQAGMDLDKFGKRKDVWEKYERIMMRFKCRSMALKSKFADLIAGVPIAEYDYNFTPELPEIKNVPSTLASDMDRHYSGEINEAQKTPEQSPAQAG